jgi:integrase
VGKLFDVSRNSLQSAFHDAAVNLGLPRTRIHDLRHTWATRFMERTGDLYALMRLGGWKDLKSVEKYQHLTRGRSKAVLSLNFGIDTPMPPEKESLPS